MVTFAPDLKLRFMPREKPGPVLRWHVIADLCLEHGLKHGAEIGVKKGMFARHILDKVPGSSLVCVDPWAPTPGYDHWDHEKNYREFLAVTAGKATTVLRMTGHEAAEHVPDGSLDFVFIDGDHRYEAVKQDIADWAPKVRKGGLVSGHDIDKYPVECAVRAMYAAYETGANSVWMVWK